MGLLDIFTGGSAKDAAAENIARLDAYKKEGMDFLNAGLKGALGSLDTAKTYFQPLSDLATKYGAGTSLYLDSLGVNGAQGNANAVNAFQAGPGYDFALNTGLDALDRRAASRGMLASGNNTLDTLGFAQGLANQEYGNWQNRLAGLVSPELSATGATASGLSGLEAGKAPIYMNDANARVGLAGNVVGGINNQNTQAANAEMAGSGNLWNLGLNLARLGTGFLGGGIGGLGGATFSGTGTQASMGGGFGGGVFG